MFAMPCPVTLGACHGAGASSCSNRFLHRFLGHSHRKTVKNPSMTIPRVQMMHLSLESEVQIEGKCETFYRQN